MRAWRPALRGGASHRTSRSGPMVLLLAAVGLLLSACTSAYQSGSPAERVSAWARDTHLGESAGTLIGDARRVATVVDRHLATTVVHTVCLVLFQDAETAYGNLPSPDAQLTGLLARAYDAFVGSAHDCYAAGSADTALQRRATAERERGRLLLEQALAHVRHVTGSSVPTTTTTAPGGGGVFG